MQPSSQEQEVTIAWVAMQVTNSKCKGRNMLQKALIRYKDKLTKKKQYL